MNQNGKNSYENRSRSVRSSVNRRTFSDIYEQANRDKKASRMRYAKAKRRGVRKKRKLLRIFCIVSVALALLVGGLISAFLYYLKDLNVNSDFNKSPENLGLVSEDKINNNVINIALFGLDKRENETVGRSDATMVLTFDGVHKKLKITSLLRDSRVKIDGHGMNKLCHAYAYGGPELAVRTINQNYKLDIRDYVAVNFTQMAKIIDAIGGLDIELSREEAKHANGLIASTPELSHTAQIPNFKEKSKVIHLNGCQAVAYARIRKIDSEVKRVERQQKVMSLIFEKVARMSVWEYPDFVKKMLPYVETSIGGGEILGFVPFFTGGKPGLEKYRVPDETDPDVKGGMIDGVWYWSYDLRKYANKLHKFIYED